MEISTFRGYYPHFVDISAFGGYYPNFVDTIGISHIKSYIACNVSHVLCGFVMVIDISFGHIISYLDCNVRPISYILMI